jgi:hypothetical protein
MNLIVKTIAKNRAQNSIDTNVSSNLGDTTIKNPWSLIKEEKLETQNGMRYNRKVCQKSLSPVASKETLNNKPVPITALMPIEFIQILNEGSK